MFTANGYGDNADRRRKAVTGTDSAEHGSLRSFRSSLCGDWIWDVEGVYGVEDEMGELRVAHKQRKIACIGKLKTHQPLNQCLNGSYSGVLKDLNVKTE